MIRSQEPILPVNHDDGEKEDKLKKSFAAQNQSHKNNDHQPTMIDERFVRSPKFFLAIACFWPLVILALFASSTPVHNPHHHSSSGAIVSPQATVEGNHNPDAVPVTKGNGIMDKIPTTRLEWRKLLDRVDVTGYGPTHPRVAVVVVGDKKEALKESVQSVFETTDPNRIFVVCAVLDDGNVHSPTDDAFVKSLEALDTSSRPKHKQQDQEQHSSKLHVMFNGAHRRGVAASRLDAAEFVRILVRTHEDAGVKSPEEDIILVLVQAGSKFKDSTWLDVVTPNLIVKPPPHMFLDTDLAMKLANAVSFRTEPSHHMTSFDARLAPITSTPIPEHLNLSKGTSWPTPALNGAIVALRLGTFLNLPETDPARTPDPWSANLELALNLWLCADGIDILENLEAIPPPGGVYRFLPPLGLGQIARLATTWMGTDKWMMGEDFRTMFLYAYNDALEAVGTEAVPQSYWRDALAEYELDKKQQRLYKRCRSFRWFVYQVNSDLAYLADMDLQEAAKKQAEREAAFKAEEEESDSDDGAEEEEEAHNGPPPGGQEQEEEEEEEAQEEAHNVPPPPGDEKDAGQKKPTKPLRPVNLEIVQKPKMVDIAYVDVSGGHQEHPHMGALDAEGKPGYIHDEQALRKNPPPLNYSGQPLQEACSVRDNNRRMMDERIVVEKDYDAKQSASGKPRDKIFCLVYTTESAHDRIPNIRETWGPKCDGFMVGSTKTDPSIGAVNIPHEGPEEYNNIWQKVRSMWSYIYDNYYETYDWFHIGGDDLFLIVENLRYYLESEEIRTASNGGVYLPPEGKPVTKQTPLLLGRRFAYQGDMNNIFDSGGSGYTMNKAAFKLLVTEGFPNYFPHRKTFSEDTMVATLFKKIDSILPYDTKDDAGGERYMPFLPGHHYGYHLPKDPSKDWYAKYSIDIKEGPEHCSPQSVAFHYVKGDMMKRLFALTYGLCPKNEGAVTAKQ